MQELRDEQADLNNSFKQIKENVQTDWWMGLVRYDQNPPVWYKFTRMLEQFGSKWDGHLESIEAVQHRIKLDKTDRRPIHPAPYYAWPKAREFENQESNWMLAMDVIRPRQAELTSRIVFVPEKDGTFRHFVHDQSLNALTLQNSYSILRMDDCMDWLASGTIVSTLDANRRYWQVEVAEEDRNKAAHTSHHGLFGFWIEEWARDVSESSESHTEKGQWQFAFVYLDDIVIVWPTPDEHIGHFWQVLRVSHEASVTLDLKKCEVSTNLLNTTAMFLGLLPRIINMYVWHHMQTPILNYSDGPPIILVLCT